MVWRAETLNYRYLSDIGLRGIHLIFIKNSYQSENSQEGLPQGSILSAECFAVAIHQIINQLGTEVCNTYVGDFVIFMSAGNETLSNRLILTIINKQGWTRKLRMRFSSEKKIVIKFEKHKIGTDLVLTLYKTIQVKERI